MLPDDARSIFRKVASLNILAHDVINLLYSFEALKKMLMSVDLTSIGFDKNANHF